MNLDANERLKRNMWVIGIFTTLFGGFGIFILVRAQDAAGQILSFAAVPAVLITLWALMLWRMRARLAANIELFGVLVVLGLAVVCAATGMAAWQFLFV